MPCKGTERLVVELPPKLKEFLASEAKKHGTSMRHIVLRQLEAWQGNVQRARTNNPNRAKP
jgi:hypothetical protein